MEETEHNHQDTRTYRINSWSFVGSKQFSTNWLPTGWNFLCRRSAPWKKPLKTASVRKLEKGDTVLSSVPEGQAQARPPSCTGTYVTLWRPEGKC